MRTSNSLQVGVKVRILLGHTRPDSSGPNRRERVRLGPSLRSAVECACWTWDAMCQRSRMQPREEEHLRIVFRRQDGPGVAAKVTEMFLGLYDQSALRVRTSVD